VNEIFEDSMVFATSDKLEIKLCDKNVVEVKCVEKIDMIMLLDILKVWIQ